MAGSSLIPEEESTSAGGNLLNVGTSSPSQETPASSTNFFSQLNWQQQTGESAGYVPFQDQNEESESSSEDGQDPFLTTGGRSTSNGMDTMFANFGAFQSESVQESSKPNGSVRSNPVPSQPEIKLIDFTIVEEDESGETVVPSSAPRGGGYIDPFQQQPSGSSSSNSSTSKPANDPFTSFESFDPWGASTLSSSYGEFQGKNDEEVSNLLGLDDSDEHSKVSDLQSEVRAVGAEPFSEHFGSGSTSTSNKEQDQSTSPNQIDPFGFTQSGSSTATSGTTSTGGGGALLDFMSDNSPGSSSTSGQSNVKQPPPPSSSSQDPFGFLSPPTMSSTQVPVDPRKLPRRVSTPENLLNAPHSRTGVSQQPTFNTYSGGHSGHSNRSLSAPHNQMRFSHSQPNLSAFDLAGQYQPPTSAARTSQSVYRGSVSTSTTPRSGSPNPPTSAHSGSTGNLSTVTSSSSAGPFAQFNLKQMTGSNPQGTRPTPKQPTSQPNFKSAVGNNAYQPYYMRHPSNSGPSMPQVPKPQAQKQTRMGMGMGPTFGSNSVFSQRSQSPNYNPIVGPGTGSKTGIVCVC